MQKLSMIILASNRSLFRKKWETVLILWRLFPTRPLIFNPKYGVNDETSLVAEMKIIVGFLDVHVGTQYH